MSAFRLGSMVRNGEFVRTDSVFRDWVRADGSTAFLPEPGRYHLYVALACPWSHRAVIVRRLKGLEDVVGVSYLHPFRDESGWAFTGDGYVDDVNGWEYLAEAYEASRPAYDGRVSVPVLWDRETGQIVSNESADIIRMFNSEFDEWGDTTVDLYPEELRREIDELDERIYENLNNAVYQAGFAESQEAYESAYRRVFEILPELDDRLASRRFLTGDQITEADWRLWVTLVRFDPVYNTHFRCNGARVMDFPNLWGYTRELYQLPGVAETVAMDEIKRHYYTTHDMLNPKRIIPLGPEGFDLGAPHGRG
ncbi:MAG: glutathionyl-hydroquinone reductase [Thermoleophilaceae bacterium]|nr:glutathionyl-hydroquinone reductase [Thermoleophilaceae bacterium]